MWGIIHMVVELFMKHEDGKYVMMKVSRYVLPSSGCTAVAGCDPPFDGVLIDFCFVAMYFEEAK